MANRLKKKTPPPPDPRRARAAHDRAGRGRVAHDGAAPDAGGHRDDRLGGGALHPHTILLIVSKCVISTKLLLVVSR